MNVVFLSGDLASSKQFVEKIAQQMPGVLLMADNTDVLEQAQQEQKAGGKANPYDGIITAGGLTARNTTAGRTGRTARASTRRRPTRPRPTPR